MDDILPPAKFVRTFNLRKFVADCVVALRDETGEEMVGLFARLFDGFGEGERSPLLFDLQFEILHVANFTSYGKQAFVVAEEVAAELGKTTVSGVKWSDIRAPYQGMYVHFERPIKLSERVADLVGFYFNKDSSEIAIGLVYLGAFDLSDQESASWPHHGLRHFRFDTTYEHDLETSLSLALDGAVVNQAETEKNFDLSLNQRQAGWFLYNQRKERELNRYAKEYTLALHLVANVLCLLTAPPEGIVQPYRLVPHFEDGTTKKQSRKLGALLARRIAFGQSAESGVGASGGGTSPRAHWRRGHWRRSRTGARTDWVYSLRWIRPTLVNGQFGSPAEETVYEVTK